MIFVYGLAVGVLAGGALSYLYAAKVIAGYKKAAAELAKVEGRLQAGKKSLY